MGILSYCRMIKLSLGHINIIIFSFGEVKNMLFLAGWNPHPTALCKIQIWRDNFNYKSFNFDNKIYKIFTWTHGQIDTLIYNFSVWPSPPKSVGG